MGHSEGLKADSWIRIEVQVALKEMDRTLCNNVKNSTSTGMEEKVIKPGPQSWWLIQTTNVPSEGLTMWVNYTVDTRKCCCKVDFSVNYRWLDYADLHPDEHWPDNWLQYGPGKEFWIDIQWTSRATRQRPLAGGTCEFKTDGWPFGVER